MTSSSSSMSCHPSTGTTADCVVTRWLKSRKMEPPLFAWEILLAQLGREATLFCYWMGSVGINHCEAIPKSIGPSPDCPTTTSGAWNLRRYQAGSRCALLSASRLGFKKTGWRSWIFVGRRSGIVLLARSISAVLSVSLTSVQSSTVLCVMRAR